MSSPLYEYQKDALRAIEAEVRSTIDSMIDSPGDYFSLEGMEDLAQELDRDATRRWVARKLLGGSEMV